MNKKMKSKIKSLTCYLIIISIVLFNANTVKAVENNLKPNREWFKLYGGTGLDEAQQVIETSDGNYITVGKTGSSDGDLPGQSMGYSDAIIMKTDKLGNIIWIKNIGGSSVDWFRSVVETPDGGFIAVGSSASEDGVHAGKNITHGSYDGSIVKLDSNGNVEWVKHIGGTKYDYLERVTQTSDGNYVAVGNSYSNDVQLKDKHYGSTFSEDGLVVKFDIEGNVLWNKNIGGSSVDLLTSVDKTLDGGAIVAGYSRSNDFDLTGKHNGYSTGSNDGIVAKLDASGNIEWIKNVGGTTEDYINSIKFIENEGYIMTGNSKSKDGDLESKNYGDVDGIVVKMSMDGNIEWVKNFGGSLSENFREIILTSDGGYAVAGNTTSKNHDFEGYSGGLGGVVIKFSSDASIQWFETYRGVQYFHSLDQTKDGGFIVGGYTSYNDADVEGHGSHDIFLTKLQGTIEEKPPVDTEDGEWLKLYGGASADRIYQVKETSDGNHIVVGDSLSNDGDLEGNNIGNWDSIIMKVDKNGNIIWIKNIGGLSVDGFKSVVETPDGGYIAVGNSASRDGMYDGKNIGEQDGTIVKFDSNGNVEWIKNIGGTKNDYLERVTQISDGNYVAVGRSNSNDVQLEGKHYGSTEHQDGLVVKFDIEGNILWEKNIGGSYDDALTSVDKTFDGGSIVAGYSKSNDFDFTGKHNGLTETYDGVVIKLDASGNTEWVKNLGGTSVDQINSIKFIENEGYIIAGNSASKDGDLQSKNYGDLDGIIGKMSMDGNIEWIKNIGGTNTEYFNEIIVTSDGGYAIAGTTSSKDRDFKYSLDNPESGVDGFIIKLSSDASIEWSRRYDGNNEDYINSLDQKKHGGFIVGGYMSSNDYQYSGNKGSYDIILSRF